MSFSIGAIGGPAHAQAVTGASPGMSPQQKMTNLYNNIDTNHSGSISQAQFNQAFATQNPPNVFKAAGAEAVWSGLKSDATGQVSRNDFVNGMKNMMVQLRQGSSVSSQASRTSQDAFVTLSSLGSQAIQNGS